MNRKSVPEGFISPTAVLARISTTPNEAGELFLLTGGRGCGKTTWCRELARQASLSGVQPAGLVSPAVFAAGKKTAIDLVDLASGERRRLAERRGEPDPFRGQGPDSLSWRFDQDTLAWGNQILAGLETSELLILDELGPLEFHYHNGLTSGMKYLDKRTYGLACVVVRPGLLAAALERWPWGRVMQIAGRPAEGSRA
jgi:nucleoside-triphosphatase THEP1